jgi:hypothetical protein
VVQLRVVNHVVEFGDLGNVKPEIDATEGKFTSFDILVMKKTYLYRIKHVFTSTRKRLNILLCSFCLFPYPILYITLVAEVKMSDRNTAPALVLAS